MNIDFHYGVVYAVARLAGMSADDARIVAHACQYVDDATTTGILAFEGGETYERFASAHTMHDYHNIENSLNRLVWTPFHFLPGNRGTTLEDRAICRPDSAIAREVIHRAIRDADAPNALHRFGVSLHVYIDTWAHQGFSGVVSPVNRVHDLRIDASQSGQGWLEELERATRHLVEGVAVDAVSRFLPVGHGAALSYPDQPWLKWRYRNGRDEWIERDNLPQFLHAADMACRAVRGFLARDERFDALPGLPAATLDSLRRHLDTSRDEDPLVRLRVFEEAVAEGALPGLKEPVPVYIAKGEGSWKHRALGITANDDGHHKPVHTDVFERSDYRYFHDAVQEHRFVVTREILPAFGLRLT